MKNTKQILGLVALLCLNQPVIKASDSLCPVTCEIVVASYNHDQHKDAVLKLLQESARELGYEGGNIEELAEFGSSDEHCQVLINSGRVIGFTVFAKLFETEGHIRVLVISKQFRNRGFGKMLLDSAVTTLRSEGAQCVIASVYEDLIGGGKFWIKHGFEVLKDPETGEVVFIADRDVVNPASAKNARMMNGYIFKNIHSWVYNGWLL